MLTFPLYMDYQATTPVDPRVLDRMLPYFTARFGNAASRHHAFGWEAGDAVERARRQIAQLIGASAKEIVFTSGATESDNLAIRGVAEGHRDKGDHVLTCAAEHRAVLDSCRRLERHGFRVTYLPLERDGRVGLDTLRRAITDRTILITIMTANNEIGVIQPIAEIGAIARDEGILFHTDAVQAVGKVPFDVNALAVDLVSMSAHKMYGPKGVGALYVRRRDPRVVLAPLLEGGGHERGMRSGTLNVPGIVGFGRAAELCAEEMVAEAERLGTLRDRLGAKLHEGLAGLVVNGSMADRLPHNLNISFSAVEGESLLMAMNDVALSSGAACTAASREPSHVLKALGLEDDLARSSIRFSLGRFTTEEEVDYVADKMIRVVRHLRDRSPGNVPAEDDEESSGIEWRRPGV